MINKRMAENYLRDAEAILAEAKAAQRRRLFHRVVRLAQESFELSLKGILRSIGVEYPKEHEVSDALKENSASFPEWFQSRVAHLEEGSVWLAERRGPSMYGDEIAGKPASRLFTASDSRKALEYADTAVKLGKRLLHELFAPRPSGETDPAIVALKESCKTGSPSRGRLAFSSESVDALRLIDSDILIYAMNSNHIAHPYCSPILERAV